MVPFFVSIASLIMVSRTFNLKGIVDLQRDYWNVVYQPLGFITAVLSIVMIMKLLGLNREGKQGLSAINMREGAGIPWVIYRFSGYSIVLFMTYLMTIVYLGGYKNLYFVRGDVMLGIKFYVVFIFILFAGKALGSNMSDAGLLMRINGKFLIPLSLINYIITMGFFIYRNIYGLI
jgi:NADH-quinone oxidoreductase subunit H